MYQTLRIFFIVISLGVPQPHSRNKTLYTLEIPNKLHKLIKRANLLGVCLFSEKKFYLKLIKKYDAKKKKIRGCVPDIFLDQNEKKYFIILISCFLLIYYYTLLSE